jgi:hypothetical protein
MRPISPIASGSHPIVGCDIVVAGHISSSDCLVLASPSAWPTQRRAGAHLLTSFAKIPFEAHRRPAQFAPVCSRTLWTKFHFITRYQRVTIMPGQPLLRQPICGAYARSTGKPCQRSRLPGRPRCIMHGGHPRSGKRTPEGIQRAIEGTKRYWRARRFAEALAATGMPRE